MHIILFLSAHSLPHPGGGPGRGRRGQAQSHPFLLPCVGPELGQGAGLRWEVFIQIGSDYKRSKNGTVGEKP